MHKAIQDFGMHCLNEILVGEIIQKSGDLELKREGGKKTDHDFAVPISHLCQGLHQWNSLGFSSDICT